MSQNNNNNNNNNATNTLSNRALLVYLSISQWAGRKLDKGATLKVAGDYQASADAGRYNKKLLPNSRELARIANAAKSMRDFFYQETLPWLSDGARIIASDNYMNFTAGYRQREGEFKTAVNDFLLAYPTLQKNAEATLGQLYNAADYLPASELARAFSCEVAFLPLPDVTDFRTDVSDAEREAFIKKMQDIQREGVQDLVSRLHDVVNKAVERLSQPGAVFRDSLLENIKETCEVLSRVNVTQDASVLDLKNKVEEIINTTSADLLRSNASKRQDAAAKLAAITSTMGAFMGAGEVHNG